MTFIYKLENFHHLADMQLRSKISKSRILITTNSPTNGPWVVLKRLTDSQIQQFTKRSSIISKSRPKRIKKPPKRYVHFANPIVNNSVISSTTTKESNAQETSHELLKIDCKESHNYSLVNLSNLENHLIGLENKSDTTPTEDRYVDPKCGKPNKTNSFQKGPWVVLERLLESEQEFLTKKSSVISNSRPETMKIISRTYNSYANPTRSNVNSIITQQNVPKDCQKYQVVKEVEVCNLTSVSNPVDSLESSKANFYVTSASIQVPDTDVDPREYKSFVNPLINKVAVSSTRTDEIGLHRNSRKIVRFRTLSSEEDLSVPVMLATSFITRSPSNNSIACTSISYDYEDSLNLDVKNSDIKSSTFEDGTTDTESRGEFDVNDGVSENPLEDDTTFTECKGEFDVNDNISENPQVDDVIEPSQVQQMNANHSAPPPNQEQPRRNQQQVKIPNIKFVADTVYMNNYFFNYVNQ